MNSTRVIALASLLWGSLLFGGCGALPHGPVATSSVVVAGKGAADLSRTFASPAEKIAPTKSQWPSRAAAQAACQAYAAAIGGTAEITSGSRSMEPTIRGQTYFVVQKLPFESINRNDLLVYMGRPNAAKPDRVKILHRAVQHDRHGWIMSGDNNRWSETWDRVTPQTYVGVAVAFFEFPQG